MADGRRRNADGSTSTLVNGRWVTSGAGPSGRGATPPPSGGRRGTPASNVMMQNPTPNPGKQFIDAMSGAGKSIQGQIGADVEGKQYSFERNLEANRVDQVDPYGETKWTQGPDGRWTQSFTESDPQRGIRTQAENSDLQTGKTFNDLGQKAAANFGQSYSLSGAPQVPGMGDRIGERQRMENSLMDRFNERMNPEWDRQRRNMEQQLADEGITPGSAQYSNRMKLLGDQQESARRDYNVSALQLGGSEMERTSNLAGQDYDRYVQRYDKERYAPTTDMAALGQSAAMVPRERGNQWQPTAAVDFGAIDIGGAVNADLERQRIRKMGSGGRGGGGGGDGSGTLYAPIGDMLAPRPSVPEGQSMVSRIIQGGSQGIGQGLMMGGQRSNALFRNPG